MSNPEGQPDPPRRPRFQFSLRTLLLLFVVLGASLGLFREAAIVVFPIVLGLALYFNRARDLSPNLLVITVM